MLLRELSTLPKARLPVPSAIELMSGGASVVPVVLEDAWNGVTSLPTRLTVVDGLPGR